VTAHLRAGMKRRHAIARAKADGRTSPCSRARTIPRRCSSLCPSIRGSAQGSPSERLPPPCGERAVPARTTSRERQSCGGC
jgi:hypothetical protein